MSSQEIRKKVQLGETAATIVCAERFIDSAIEGIASARKAIKSFAKNRPEFLASLEPLDAPGNAPEIVKSMCRAGRTAGVGPMASVAGAIAAEGVRRAMESGSDHCIIDNGGDIAMVLSRPVTIGILESLESADIPAVEIEATDGKMFGLCTSSGVFGHSISFGKAEAATVMASDPALADACATALGNACKGAESLEFALEGISRIDGVLWAMAIAEGRVGTAGRAPRFVPGRRRDGDVTVHSKFPAKIAVKG